jgi:UDP-N-acetylmuramyl pentapeptide phosphotransferase/UDP-N-acetylglucosamine-1-phosphate transferase
MLFLSTILILNFLLTFYFKKFSEYIGLFDYPDKNRKLHKSPVASIGGCIIFANLFVFFIFKSIQNFYFDINFEDNYYNFLIFFIFSSLFFFIGFLDDKYGLGPNLKLFVFSIFILCILFILEDLALTSVRFSFIEKSLNISSIKFPFTMLCILLFLNAFNMFDGINLQSAIYSLHIFLIFILQGIYVDISLVMIISLIFFSYLNFKNKCFLGNNGSLVIAFIISYLFINSQSSLYPFYADEIFLAMEIPGLDLLRLAIQRSLAKKHPFYPDRNHIHHLLINKLGFQRTLFVLLSLIIIPNFLSALYGNTLYYIILSLIVYIFIIFRLKK